MNNKGFAITGVLYTIMILFLLILLSILAGLSSRNNLLKKSVESLESNFVGKEIKEFTITENKAPFTGKYVFRVTGGPEDTECYSFINKDSELKVSTTDGETDVTNITFVTNDCNTKKNNSLYKFYLTKIYSFDN